MPTEESTVSTGFPLLVFISIVDAIYNELFSIAAYMSSPCHIELILSEKEEPVKKEVITTSF